VPYVAFEKHKEMRRLEHAWHATCEQTATQHEEHPCTKIARVLHKRESQGEGRATAPRPPNCQAPVGILCCSWVSQRPAATVEEASRRQASSMCDRPALSRGLCDERNDALFVAAGEGHLIWLVVGAHDVGGVGRVREAEAVADLVDGDREELEEVLVR